MTKKRILIVGLGATGSNLALLLSKNRKVASIDGLDFDAVEEKNTQVSLLYRLGDVNYQKSTIVRNRLNITTIDKKIEGFVELDELDLDYYTHVILCLDNIKARNLIIYKLLSFENEGKNRPILIDVGIGDHWTSDIRFNFDNDKLRKLLNVRQISKNVTETIDFENFLTENMNVTEQQKEEICGNSTSLQINMFTISYLYLLLVNGFDTPNVMFDIDIRREPSEIIIQLEY